MAADLVPVDVSRIRVLPAVRVNQDFLKDRLYSGGGSTVVLFQPEKSFVAPDCI
jgi:hypothetical protein